MASFLADPKFQVALQVLAAVGLTWVAFQLAGAVYGLYTMFLRPGKNLKKSYGSWAIVTGCTDGIGKAIAKELAKKKINVILVSRTQAKLEEFGKELQSKYSVQTKAVAIDLSVPPSDPVVAKGYAEIEKLVKEVDVGILVNNAGVSYPFAKFVHEIDEQLVNSIITVNIVAATKLTRIVIPEMLARKRGAIINTGSGAATVIPSDPLYAIYAASKAYVDQFSKTLKVEYSQKGIDVQCQAPLYVTTKLAKIRTSSLTCPTPEGYAKASLKWIGYEPRCTPYWAHQAMWALISRMPVGFVDSSRLSQNLGIRKRGLAKEAKSKQG